MENKPERSSLTAADAAAALSDAEASRAALAQSVETPSWFFTALGVAIAVQIATAALGVADPSPWTLAALAAGIGLLAVVGGAQLARFRQLNGVWLGGLASRVVFGNERLVAVAYTLALGAAIWAAFGSRWWLVIAWSIIGGAAYALCGRRWLRAYRAEPVGHARGDSLVWFGLLAVAALAGFAFLLFNS
jgi:hypothetical protein